MCISAQQCATPAGGYGAVTPARIALLQADITAQHVDALVDAANSLLLGGGGVDGAIHRRGEPAILAQCQQLRASRYPHGLPTGHAVATTGGDLPARWVIHAVGPIYAHPRNWVMTAPPEVQQASS